MCWKWSYLCFLNHFWFQTASYYSDYGSVLGSSTSKDKYDAPKWYYVEILNIKAQIYQEFKVWAIMKGWAMIGQPPAEFRKMLRIWRLLIFSVKEQEENSDSTDLKGEGAEEIVGKFGKVHQLPEGVPLSPVKHSLLACERPRLNAEPQGVSGGWPDLRATASHTRASSAFLTLSCT